MMHGQKNIKLYFVMFQSILWRYVGHDICDSDIKSEYL